MMKRWIKKAATWLVIVCMFTGFLSAFGTAAAAEGKPIRSLEAVAGRANGPASAAVLAAQPTEAGDLEDNQEESGPDTLVGLLVLLMQEIGKNLRSISVDDILKLPAGVMDDVVTYIFAILKGLGVNVEWLYEKLTSIIPFH